MKKENMQKKILIVDNHSVHIEELKRLFGGYEIDVCDCDDFTTEKAADFDVIMLSGGSHVFAADQTKKAYEVEIDFIHNTEKPVIGICLGCQLIAKAFGGTLKKLETGCHGINEIEMENRKYQVFESHNYGIDTLPNELKIIAKSVVGTEIIKHKTKEIYCFQFHPEVHPRKTDGKKIFYKIVSEIL